MRGFSGLKRQSKTTGEQISIESKIERTVEEEVSDDSVWRTRLEPQVSVSIRRGSDAGIEWLPRPTCSSQDPLNWPRWKTELAFSSLILLNSTASALKLVFAPLNAVLSNEFGVTYFAAACLTGVPMIVGGLTSPGSAVLSRIVGRRAILLAGAMLLFVGSTWNLEIGTAYVQFMAARVFQGIGWGMIDAVIGDHVQEMFYYHKQALRVNIFNTFTTFHTWLAPVLSGYLYERRSWRTMFLVVGIFQTVSLIFLILFTPETQYDRTPSTGDFDLKIDADQMKSGAASTSTIITSSSVLTPSVWKQFLASLRFPSPARPRNILLPLKAQLAPSTIVAFLLQGPLTASVYGLASSLALIFSVAPTFLLPARIGFLFLLPACFVLACHLIHTAFGIWKAKRTSTQHRPRTTSMVVITQLLILGAGGIAGLGLYTCNKLGPKMVMSSEVVTVVDGEMMNEHRLWIVGGLFGAAATGAVGARLFGHAHLNPRTTTRDAMTMKAGEYIMEREHHVASLVTTATQIYTNTLAGIFALALPIWVSTGHTVPSQTASAGMPTSSPTGPWKRHGETDSVSVTAEPKQMEMEMLMGIQITVVSLAIVALVISGLAAVGLVFGRENLRRKDLKTFNMRSERTTQEDEVEMETR